VNNNTHEGVMKVITQKITLLASINEINAHKNEYNTSGAKLLPTPSVT
jgi:hypothetical protein